MRHDAPRFRLRCLRCTLLAVAALASGATWSAPEGVEQGRELYRQYCETCHGPDMVTSSKLVFDLRQFPKDAAQRFRQSVANGKGAGMPAWRDSLSADDIDLLWAYVRAGGGS